MNLFKSRERLISPAPQPVAPGMPLAGERLTVRPEGGTRLWLAAAQTVAQDILGLEIDLRAHQDCRDTIKAGQVVHVSGLSDQPVRLRAEARGHNGPVLLLHELTPLEARPARQLARIPVRGSLWVTSLLNPSGARADVFDLSLGGLSLRSPRGVRAGDTIGLGVHPGPHAALVRGAIAHVRTGPDGDEVLHVGFLAGTTTQAVATLVGGLAECPTPARGAPAPHGKPEHLLPA